MNGAGYRGERQTRLIYHHNSRATFFIWCLRDQGLVYRGSFPFGERYHNTTVMIVVKGCGVVTEKQWTEIKLEYATTGISYRKLADKRGVSFNTLKARAKREGWVKQKNGYQEAVTTKTLQKAATKASDNCAKQLVKVGQAAGIAAGMIEKMISDPDQFRRHIVTVKKGEGFGKGLYEETQDIEERVLEKYDTKALKEFTAALKDLVSVIRNVNGLPTVLEESAMDLALKRLQLERDKANIVDTANVIEVEFTDDLKELAE